MNRILAVYSVLISLFAVTSAFFIMLKLKNKISNDVNFKLDAMKDNIIHALTSAIDANDFYNEGHSARVADYAKEIARRLGKSEIEQKEIYFAALLHDIGKIRVPDEILKSDGDLSEREFDSIKLHSMIGYSIVQGVSENKNIEDAVKYHHERYDGEGYPIGLKGEQIPEYARIICVADSYDAMSSDRRFRKDIPQEFIKEKILQEKGRQFDPEIASVMLEMIEEDVDFKMRPKYSPIRKILVIDDDAICLKVTSYMLKKNPDYIVKTASSGTEGLKYLENENFDLVLLDIEMPDMNGFETFAKLKKIKDVPVIFVTVDKDVDTIVRARACGVNYYLIKPFLSQELNEAIRNVFLQRGKF